MHSPPDALRDPARLQALRDTGLLDSPPEHAFDRITRLAARFLDAPLAFVNLVDDRREFTKSCFAPPDWPVTRDTPLDASFCRHTVGSGAPVRIDDTATDPRVPAAPAAHGGRIGAYLGVPLRDSRGQVLGALCVADPEPRGWSDGEVELLGELAELVSTEIELRAEIRAHEHRHRELLAAKEEAERANGAKTEFVSRMSHELRTPLNAILGFGQLLEMEAGAECDRESVDQILRAGRHLLRLIDEVLDIARIEAGHVNLSIEPVPLRDAIGDSWRLLQGMAAERDVTIRILLPEHPDPMVWADDQRLRQVMLNLFSNAIKYNRRGGTITVSTREAGEGFLRVAVTDTGEGISPRNLERLFVPFERLDAVRSGVEGTGLGLALSKGLVEVMGGRFGAESAEGEGSTFWLDLPVVRLDDIDVPPRSRSAEAANATPEGDFTVLLVEDNLANSRLIEHVLQRRSDVRLVTAMQGSRGLELARHLRPDLIILDLNLPDLSGEEVLVELRRGPLWAIPVIMISGAAAGADVERSLSLGASAFLMKPFDLQEFVRTVDEFLDR